MVITMPLLEIQNRMERAALTAGRTPESVRLVAVTKGHSQQDIERCVLEHGRFALAENKGQELRDKKPLFPAETEWHFIGPLQRNKIKYLEGVRLIHTLESLDVALELVKYAEKWGRAPALLIQLHNGEAQKHGVDESEVPALLREVRALGLEVRGLMVMAPYQEGPEDSARVEAVFQRTAELAYALELSELSMGMSGDFEAAIRLGSTMVRVGSALFDF